MDNKIGTSIDKEYFWMKDILKFEKRLFDSASNIYVIFYIHIREIVIHLIFNKYVCIYM